MSNESHSVGASGANTGAIGIVAGQTKKPRHLRACYSRVIEDPAKVVRIGYISQGEADAIWKATIKDWGISDSNEEGRNSLKERVAEAFAISTSKDDENLDTRFEFDGVWYGLRVLYDNAVKIAPGKNDSYVRVFIRSYNYAQFTCMISDLLGNPENIELRQEMAYRCGGQVEDAYLMGDTMVAALNLSGRYYSAAERAKIERFSNYRNTHAQMRSAQSGLGGPANDSSSRQQAVNVPDVRKPVPKQSADVRTAFAPVNPR